MTSLKPPNNGKPIKTENGATRSQVNNQIDVKPQPKKLDETL
ncbi:hypothetical protein OGM63_22860 [Plectonema radiosum NIES-515]|jgi:hypothetical protein|uniref:Uncharacterized protein n=1 Tax=Plectonema radiosum NIES-515 TaxID=2986073 RepID=A0ABT3B4N3_9CYAN|nr:hypothetical protein [Plectonema radiosum]MCV3216319.1 hypothetical protein [Plectonema radiosum NIES-515]